MEVYIAWTSDLRDLTQTPSRNIFYVGTQYIHKCTQYIHAKLKHKLHETMPLWHKVHCYVLFSFNKCRSIPTKVISPLIDESGPLLKHTLFCLSSIYLWRAFRESLALSRTGYSWVANHLLVSKIEEIWVSRWPPSIQTQDGTDGDRPFIHESF